MAAKDVTKMTHEEFKQHMMEEWDKYNKAVDEWSGYAKYKKDYEESVVRHNKRVAIIANILAFIVVVCNFPFCLMFHWWVKFVRFLKTEL